jgi:hypothetical protein
MRPDLEAKGVELRRRRSERCFAGLAAKGLCRTSDVAKIRA